MSSTVKCESVDKQSNLLLQKLLMEESDMEGKVRSQRTEGYSIHDRRERAANFVREVGFILCEKLVYFV